MRYTSEQFECEGLYNLDFGDRLVLGVPIQREAVQINVQGAIQLGRIILTRCATDQSITVRRDTYVPLQVEIPDYSMLSRQDPRLRGARLPVFERPVSAVIFTPVGESELYRAWTATTEKAPIVESFRVERFANIIALHGNQKVNKLREQVVDEAGDSEVVTS